MTQAGHGNDAPATSYVVVIANTGESFRCGVGESILAAMERIRRKGIPVGCRNGGCGVCKVEVIEGHFTRRKMSRAVVTAEEEARGQVLACRIHPQSDLRIQAVGKMARAVEVQQDRTSFVSGLTTTPAASQPDTET